MFLIKSTNFKLRFNHNQLHLAKWILISITWYNFWLKCKICRAKYLKWIRYSRFRGISHGLEVKFMRYQEMKNLILIICLFPKIYYYKIHFSTLYVGFSANKSYQKPSNHLFNPFDISYRRVKIPNLKGYYLKLNTNYKCYFSLWYKWAKVTTRQCQDLSKISLIQYCFTFMKAHNSSSVSEIKIQTFPSWAMIHVWKRTPVCNKPYVITSRFPQSITKKHSL